MAVTFGTLAFRMGFEKEFFLEATRDVVKPLLTLTSEALCFIPSLWLLVLILSLLSLTLLCRCRLLFNLGAGFVLVLFGNMFSLSCCLVNRLK